MRDSVETNAVELVTRYYRNLGYSVENVSRRRGEHAGYDLFIQKGRCHLKIEVKGCTRPYGIPDPYCTEFDSETLTLVADFLCVVYFRVGENPELAVIPRDAIPPEFIKVKMGYRISGKFKNQETIGKFLVKLS